MGFFSKKICDADYCFIRDMMDVGSVLAKVTSLAVAKEWMKQLMIQYDLSQKVYDYTSHNITALDCYPTDPNLKYQRAQELLKVAKTLNLPGMAHSDVISAASQCIKRMGFSRQEKINLIDSCIVELSGIESIDEIFLSTYLGDL